MDWVKSGSNAVQDVNLERLLDKAGDLVNLKREFSNGEPYPPQDTTSPVYRLRLEFLGRALEKMYTIYETQSVTNKADILRTSFDISSADGSTDDHQLTVVFEGASLRIVSSSTIDFIPESPRYQKRLDVFFSSGDDPRFEVGEHGWHQLPLRLSISPSGREILARLRNAIGDFRGLVDLTSNLYQNKHAQGLTQNKMP